MLDVRCQISELASVVSLPRQTLTAETQRTRRLHRDRAFSNRKTLIPSPLKLAAFLACIVVSIALNGRAQSGTVRPLPPQAPVHQPPVAGRPNNQTITGQSTVKGRVVYKDNARGLKGARVHVIPANINSSGPADRPMRRMPGVVAFTNDQGEFEIQNLAAGKYYFTVESANLAAPNSFGMRLPIPMGAIPRREDFEEIVPRHDGEFTVDGTNTVQVEFEVVRGGNLSGKVLQPNRAPVAGVQISIVSRSGSGLGAYQTQFSTETDRHGEYKMENLPPGEYFVAAATEGKPDGLDMLARLQGASRILTYHPAAVRIRDAMSVRVESGHETSGVNITLVERSTFAVAGTVVRQLDGTPMAGVTVILQNKEPETGGAWSVGMGQRRTRTDSQGRWLFANVVEGSYIATAVVEGSPISLGGRMPGRVPSPDPAGREEALRSLRQPLLMAEQELELVGGDQRSVTIAISGPGSIRGTVATESGDALPADLVVFLELVREGSRPGRPLPVRVKDGAFSVSDVQGGQVYLAVALPPGSPMVIKSVTANGEDPRRTPLRVVEGAEAGPVQIVVSSGAGLLTGRVVSEKNGEGLSGYVLLLAPTATEKQRFRTAYLTARTAADGSFSISGEPGEYFVFARKREQLPAIVTEEFVRAEGLKAERVTLTPGDPRQLEIKIP